MSYAGVIKKEFRPHVESLRDDIVARRDPDFFWPTGTQVYCGRQGSGKTISAVKHIIDLKERYPKAVIVSNLAFNTLERKVFETKPELLEQLSELDPKTQYIGYDDMEQLALALTTVNNGFNGVIYVIDEIHTYFNALESKNIPMYVFTEISQQRKQRKLIVGTSQLFMRMAKPMREQCDNLIVCNTIAGIITFQRAYDGMTLTQDYDGGMSGNVKRSGFFFHNRRIRGLFDTYQKVVSGAEQYEEMNRPMTLVNKRGKPISVH
jgi:hypothetical protein